MRRSSNAEGRPIRVAVILASLTAALLAQPAAANVLTYHCDGFAMEQKGDRVWVMRSFAGDGKQMDVFAVWTPLAETASLPLPSMMVNVELQINYEGPSKAGIGTVDTAFLTLQTLPWPGQKRSSETLQSDLAKLTVEASIDGKPPVPLVWNKDQTSFDYPMTAHSRVTIRFPDTARSVAFTVRDERGRPINSTHYDLQQTAGRDAQFKIALERADQAALNFKRCSKSG